VSPDQLLSLLKSKTPGPAFLFLGAEAYRRNLCRKALISVVLGNTDPEQGLSRFDLRETSWDEITDDARSLSLFAPQRVVWVVNAEAALPRGRSSADEAEGSEGGSPGSLGALLEYLKQPTPGVTLVAEASRFELDGEDKPKAERVRKLYAAIPAVVEFPRLTAQEALQIAQRLAKQAGLAFEPGALELLVDTLGADGLRISNEIEKLALGRVKAGKITAADLAESVPDSSLSTVFALVDALSRRDRSRALQITDKLIRQGEYMPLALSFLAGLLKLALAARELGLRTPQQIQDAFSRPGRPVWPSRAQQILQTAKVFTEPQLSQALERVYQTDKAFRDARPDDRLVMENFIFGVAGTTA